MARVLVVDDQPNMRATTALMLRQAGYEVEEAASGPEALEAASNRPVDVVITDLRMTPMSGLELVAQVRDLAPSTQVLVMTAYGSVESAVEAMRLGAADYLQKPFSEEELLVRVARAVERRRLLAEVAVLTDEFRERYKLENIIGRSTILRELLARVVRIAPTDATVLITGESGTGKELIARAIHANSLRAGHPFVPVNCAAINEQLLESELFGHAKGSFTGAVATRRGLFEEADGGTFFFDEIAETTTQFQAKLLRAIQEHEIRRVGENVPIRVDVRIIAATNVDLREAVEEKRFREDLYYRLNVVPLRLPPLRERLEDVPLLAAHFLDRYNKRNGTRRRITKTGLDRLMDYTFPGNIRELENLVYQAAALSPEDDIGPDGFLLDPVRSPGSEASPPGPESANGHAPRAPWATATAGPPRWCRWPTRWPTPSASPSRWPSSTTGAASRPPPATSRISHTTLWRKMRRLGISK